MRFTNIHSLDNLIEKAKGIDLPPLQFHYELFDVIWVLVNRECDSRPGWITPKSVREYQIQASNNMPNEGWIDTKIEVGRRLDMCDGEGKIALDYVDGNSKEYSKARHALTFIAWGQGYNSNKKKPRPSYAEWKRKRPYV